VPQSIYKMKTLAIIPARGGSKRLPGKNIKDLGGKPLLAYTIEAARQAPSISRVLVSTDSDKIAQVAKQWGAEVPFMRPAELAADAVPDRPVLQHALRWLEEHEGQKYDLLAYLRPTAPFKSVSLIEECIARLKGDQQLTCVRTVTHSEGVFHPYWMFRDQQGELAAFIDGISIDTYFRSQLLPECLRLNGVVDILRTSLVMEGDSHWGAHMGFVVTDDLDSVDIDTEFDFQFCEFLLSRRQP